MAIDARLLNARRTGACSLDTYLPSRERYAVRGYTQEKKMIYARYRFTGDEKIPAVVGIGGRETPVWTQQLWDEGEYAEFIVRNGCGHCCAAMALNLFGVRINPHEEYALCRELWGAPKIDGHNGQGNFQSVSGIAKIIGHFGIAAEVYGVSTREEAAARIESALREGRPVIFESHPREDNTDNPFSRGEHWVMAVGYTEDGKILVANSSNRVPGDGVNLVSIATVSDALYLGADPADYTWGEWRDEFLHGVGYIVVG